ncbi:MAG: hypothetical protein FWG99_11695 [Treponema sp.]|nr:hypothetical protein [Treponema sp.]
MTLSERNAFFKAGIILALLCLIMVFIASFYILPAYSSLDTENIRRSDGILQFFTGRILKNSFYAVHTALSAAVIYSLISIILIYYFFEKTQAAEILFIALFSISLSLEALRLVVPLNAIFEITSLYRLMASRILLFGRFFGIFSLFTGSICAAGLEMQKPRNVILTVIVVTLVITLGTPIDIHAWNSGLNMIFGYNSLFRLVETTILIITVISFFIAANSNGSKEYVFVGLGTFLALIGRNFLISTDNWAGAIPGILLLSTGTWFICTRLRKIYMWL